MNDPAIESCPICNETTHECNGGPNQGAPCTPGDSASLGSAYPTSHDCPPASGAFIGSLPIPFALSVDKLMQLLATPTVAPNPSQSPTSPFG